MVSRERSVLTVLLRMTQWMLDDLACDLPAERSTAEQHDQLANTLEDLAAMLRAIPVRGTPTVIEGNQN